MKEMQSLPLGRSAHRDVTLRQSRNVRPFGGKFQTEVMWHPEPGQAASNPRDGGNALWKMALKEAELSSV